MFAAACGGGDDGGGEGADARRFDAPGTPDARTEGYLPGEIVWSVPLPLDVEHAPALAPDGTVVVQGQWDGEGSDGDTLVAVSADGTILWGEATLPGSVPAPPPTIDDGMVYASATTNVGGDLNALLHRVTLAGVASAPIALTGPVGDGLAVGADGTLYVPATPLHAIVGDGITWSAPMIGAGKTGSNAAVGPSGTIYVGARGLEDHTVHAIAPDGHELWATDVGAAVIDPIAIDRDEHVYALNGDGTLVVLDSAGDVSWSLALDSGSSGGGMVLDPDGTVYVGTLSATPGDIAAEVLYAARKGDGTAGVRVWARNVGYGAITTTPALSSSGVLYVSDYCQGLHAMRVSDGEILWTVEAAGREEDRCAPWSSPRLGPDGRVYAFSQGLGNGTGALVAIEGDGSGPAASAWPQQGGDAAHHARVTPVD